MLYQAWREINQKEKVVEVDVTLVTRPSVQKMFWRNTLGKSTWEKKAINVIHLTLFLFPDIKELTKFVGRSLQKNHHIYWRPFFEDFGGFRNARNYEYYQPSLDPLAYQYSADGFLGLQCFEFQVLDVRNFIKIPLSNIHLWRMNIMQMIYNLEVPSFKFTVSKILWLVLG